MPLKEQLEGLIDAMVAKGVRYTDAQREFEKSSSPTSCLSPTATSARPQRSSEFIAIP